jgi:uncharacterized protein YjbJ (UPF0337 family)
MRTILKLEEPWDEVKEKMKEVNTSLTDEDLFYEEGKEDELLNRLSKKLKKSPEDVKGLIESVSFTKGKAS